MDHQVFGVLPTPVEASVIIVTYNVDLALLQENLEALKAQQNGSFEVLIIDNSDAKDASSTARMFTCEYVRLQKNFGLQIGRNIGAMLARGAICIFLDDDAIPAPGFVRGHLDAHKRPGVVAVRGRCLGRTENQLNILAFHYDLGPVAKPSPINLEGNSSFKRGALIMVGGFNMNIPVQGGFEGTELLSRIIKQNNGGLSIYDPAPLIYHDYSTDPIKLLRKYVRHGRIRRGLENSGVEPSSVMAGFDQEHVELIPFVRKAIWKRAFLALGVFFVGSMAARIL
ncbi:MAG: glycosyltransferase family 2 protein [Methanomassiliicoccales archaeon]|nr:glycosyltransferase family 2 protein [Methanomassiliicoccales archaeon]